MIGCLPHPPKLARFALIVSLQVYRIPAAFRQ